jgi:hypothetical protein
VLDETYRIIRVSPDGQGHMLCVHNVSEREQRFQADLGVLGVPHSGVLENLVGGARYPVSEAGQIDLIVAPYQVLWMTP